MAETRIANLSRELYKNQSSLNPALFGDQDDDLFRPSLSDDVKVGFFNLDRSCQTQETDVVPLKEMTEVIQVLLKDTSIIKRDLHLTRKKLETDYENRLQDKTFELHSRINQKLQELEAMHVERVGIVRKAYRQQLADALARVETLFQARYEKQKEKEREKHKADMGKLQNQVNTLTQTIQRNESVILTLKQQLANKNKSDEQPPPPKEDTTKIDALSKELAIYKDKLKVKEKELGLLEDELDHRNAEINLAAEKYNNLQIELDKLVIIKEELAAELAEVKHQANRSTEETKLLQQLAAELEKQKQDIETEAAERAIKAREEALGASSSRMRELQAEFATKISEMTKEKEELEMLLVKERAKNLATPKKEEQPLTDVEKLVKSEKELRIQCEKLLKEIERINSAWEKKFTILQSSLYAIKDESYLRTHLEKQHTLLHQATISYTAGTPRQKNRKQQVLPSIPNRSASPDPLASYTVSRASNRHTLENQIEIDSDDEAGGAFSLHQMNQSRLNAQSAT